MSFRWPEDPESVAMVRRYVVHNADHPRYERLAGVHPPGEGDPDQDAFAAELAGDARRITDTDLGLLLEFEWRSRITAAWLIGLGRRSGYRQALGELLLESELVYAGRGYCFALARFGQHEDADILVAYLDRYLPQTESQYDQDRAVGALLHLDEKHGTDRAARFVEPGGLWHRSAFADRDPLESRRTTGAFCAFADRIMGEESEPQ